MYSILTSQSLLRTIIGLLFLCAIDSISSAQQKLRITDWNFIGRKSIAESDIKSTLMAKGMSMYNPKAEQQIRRIVLERYAAEGFYQCKIDSIESLFSQDSSSASMRIFLQEGDQTTIGRLSFIGNESFTQNEIEREVEIRTGDVLTQRILQNVLSGILTFYERNGFPFTHVVVPDIHVYDSASTQFLSVTIQIDEKGKFIISEISVEGNAATNPDVVVRETRIHSGDVYNAEKVDDVKRRIEKLSFFTSVSEPQLYQRGSKSGLLITVAEGSTNMFDGIIGYQPPRTSNEAGYLTGMVNLSFKNIFGTGRRFDARWERASQNVQEIELRYLEPWILNFPVNVEGGFFQRQQDSTYVSRSFDAKVSLLATENIQVNMLGKSFSVIPSELIASQAISSSTTLSAGIELFIDTRDNVYNPTSGVIFRNGYTGGNKSFVSPITNEKTSTYIQNFIIDVSYFHEIFDRNIAAISIHGREIKGSNIDDADYYRIGGTKTLRGYREEQFHGSRVAWANVEYHYSLNRRTFAFAFFDYGYIFLPADVSKNVEEFTAWKNGYGVGIRIETGLGIMALSYALGSGDSITNGKIHFGLVNEF